MGRLGAVAGCALWILLVGCKIERTPDEFFDQQLPATLGEEAVAELRAHVLNLIQALNRGQPETALAALAPRADAYIIGPEGGSVFSGSEQIDAALQWITALGPVSVQARDVRIAADLRGNVGWFSTDLGVPGLETAGTAALRMSGVYVREEGRWRLAQAHLSVPTKNLLNRLPTYPASPADSVVAESGPARLPSPAGGSWAQTRSPAERRAARR